MTGWRWLAARGAAALLLASSGVLMVLASVERWGPACIPAGVNSPECLAVEDDRYNFDLVSRPWTPVGHAAELYGIATLLLGLVWVVLPMLLSRGGGPVLAWVGGSLLGLTFAAQGAQTLGSGLAGEPVAESIVGPLLNIQLFLLPLVVIAALVKRRRPSAGPSLPAVATAVLLIGLIPLYPIVHLLLYVGPYDARAWYEANIGAALVLAALALWPATVPRTDADHLPDPAVPSVGPDATSSPAASSGP